MNWSILHWCNSYLWSYVRLRCSARDGFGLEGYRAGDMGYAVSTEIHRDGGDARG